MDKEILNAKDVCELLGISIKLFQKIMREENLPARRIGREWRFSKTALIDWISKGNSKDFKDKEDFKGK